MKKKLLGVFILVGLIAVVALLVQPQEADGLFQQDPTGGGEGGGCSGYLCNYCCQTSCGCSQPGGSYVFTGWCSCSSTSCFRSCEWSPVGG